MMNEATIPPALFRIFGHGTASSPRSFISKINNVDCLIVCAPSKSVSSRYIKKFAELIEDNVFTISQLNSFKDQYFVIVPEIYSNILGISNGEIKLVVYELLELVEGLESLNFPHGLLTRENVFLRNDEVILGPPQPFSDGNYDLSEFSLENDRISLGSMILALIDNKEAFHNSDISKIGRLLEGGLQISEIREKMSEEINNERELRSIFDDICAEATRHDCDMQDFIKYHEVSIPEILPIDPGNRDLYTRTEELKYEYSKLVRDTTCNRYIKVLSQYRLDFPNGALLPDRIITLYRGQDANNRELVELLMIDLRTPQEPPYFVDFAAKQGDYRTKTAKIGIINKQSMQQLLQQIPMRFCSGQSGILLIMCISVGQQRCFYNFKVDLDIDIEYVKSESGEVELLLKVIKY